MNPPLAKKAKTSHNEAMASLKFTAFTPGENDPRVNPVAIISRTENLSALKFSSLKARFGGLVTEQDFEEAKSCLKPSNFSGDTYPLKGRSINLGVVPRYTSRHSPLTHTRSFAKLIKSLLQDAPKQYFLVPCSRRDAIIVANAFSRVLSEYSAKTSGSDLSKRNVVVELIPDSDEFTNDDFEALNTLSESIRRAAKFVDMPCNVLSTTDFVSHAKAAIKDLENVEIEVIAGTELEKRGFNAIYAVGKAGPFPPAMVILKYVPKVAASRTIAWVGKGIVFDTGGLCIKTPKTVMCGMKRDMGGASAILNAFVATSKLGFTENLYAILCLAENSIASNATRPDDVFLSYSGLSIEVNNTDAEGRLVLADGVAYAKKDLKADIIVDMATLTGAQGITTGQQHAGIVTNQSLMEEAAVRAGKISGDPVFPMIFAPEVHFEEFDSKIADMKNSVANRGNAQSSCAGLFIFKHIGFDWTGTWLHVDIASPAYSGERATGFGVAFLVTLFAQLSKNSYIKSLTTKGNESNDVFNRAEEGTLVSGCVDEWLLKN